MNFREAFNYMCDNEGAVCVSQSQVRYRITDGELMVYIEGKWGRSLSSANNLMRQQWSKVEPELEAVKVVAYVSTQGKVFLAEKDSEQAEMCERQGWRKVRVKVKGVRDDQR